MAGYPWRAFIIWYARTLGGRLASCSNSILSMLTPSFSSLAIVVVYEEATSGYYDGHQQGEVLVSQIIRHGALL